ncbi:MAG: hypothetical protein IPL77_21895 [Flavobacteriales bacterium]|nr:hypothetical protein [Flavobacteriales bacterium]
MNVNNGLNVAVGPPSRSGCTIAITGASTVSGSLTFTSTAASRTFNSDVTVTGSLLFTANVPVAFGAKLIAGNGAAVGGGGSTGILSLTSDLQIPAAASATIASVTLTCNAICDAGQCHLERGHLPVQQRAYQRKRCAGREPRREHDRGIRSWINTSSAGDAYVGRQFQPGNAERRHRHAAHHRIERHGDILRSDHRQHLGTSPAIAMGANVAVTNDLDHSNGVLDLAGYALTITGSPGAETHAFNGATMITSVNGGAFTACDPSNVNRITFTNYRMGDNVRGVTTNVTCGRISFVGFTQWGTAFFTKTLNVDDVFGGGNYYHGPVTFTADATASRWRMGDNLALPDTFVDASFRANALGGTNNNFILGANSHGNAFYGLTRITSTTIGGVLRLPPERQWDVQRHLPRAGGRTRHAHGQHHLR